MPGQPLSLNVAVDPTTPPTLIQWESSSAGSGFSPIPGATGTNYTFTPDNTFNGTVIEAVASNGVGTITTQTSLTSEGYPTTTSIGSSVASGKWGVGPVKLTVTLTAADGSKLSKGTVGLTADGTPISGCTALTPAAGVATCTVASLQGSAISATYSGVPVQYQSSVGTLSIPLTPVVTLQPATNSFNYGSNIVLHSTASGPAGMTVQWQVSSDGTTFTDVSGATTSRIVLPSTGTYFGANYFRAVFTAGSVSTISATALISVIPATTTLVIVSPPKSAPYQSALPMQVQVTSPTVANISQGTVTFTFRGVPVTGCSSLPVTNGTAQCTYPLNHAGLTATYTGPSGILAPSTATATIGIAPAITLQPASASVALGSAVKLKTAAIAPTTPTVQWQTSSNGTTFTAIPGATSPNYRFHPSVTTTYLRAVYTVGLFKTKTQIAVITAS